MIPVIVELEPFPKREGSQRCALASTPTGANRMPPWAFDALALQQAWVWMRLRVPSCAAAVLELYSPLRPQTSDMRGIRTKTFGSSIAVRYADSQTSS